MEAEKTGEHTRWILQRIVQGEEAAKEELFQILYPTLRELATVRLRRERPDHTLQATALVHEAYLRLVGQRRTEWQGKAHFLAIAATTMRRILVDYARRRSARKREIPEITVTILDDEFDWETLLSLDEALERLRRERPRKAQVVELLFFGGMTGAEAAEALSMSRKTVLRDWAFSRAWLRREIAGDGHA